MARSAGCSSLNGRLGRSRSADCCATEGWIGVGGAVVIVLLKRRDPLCLARSRVRIEGINTAYIPRAFCAG